MALKRFALLQTMVLLVLALGVYVWAQAPIPAPPPQGVVSGGDIGFRVEASDLKRAVGTLMVRVDGRWLEARFSDKGPNVIPLHTK